MIEDKHICQMAFAEGYDAYKNKLSNPYKMHQDEVLFCAWHFGYTIASKIHNYGMH